MENNRTILSVKLPAGETTGGLQAQAVQQIEKAALYVGSIFNLIRLSAQRLEDSDDYELQQLGGDIGHLSEIGFGAADSLLSSVTAFDRGEPANGEPAKRQSGEKGIDRKETGAAKNEDAGEIADLLSKVLRHPALPTAVYNKLMNAVGSIYNESETDAISEYQTSSDFLNIVFADYTERGKPEKE